MMSYHFLSPALSVEENGLMAYLQSPPDAGPSVTQVNYRLTELEVCRQKTGRDWTPYGDSATPGLCENSLEASSR